MQALIRKIERRLNDLGFTDYEFTVERIETRYRMCLRIHVKSRPDVGIEEQVIKAESFLSTVQVDRACIDIMDEDLDRMLGQHLGLIWAKLYRQEQPCAHEWTGHKNPDTPDGPGDYVEVCRKCGCENPGSYVE